MNLMDKAQKEFEERREYLRRYEKAIETAKLFPSEIKELDCQWFSAYSDGKLQLSFSGDDAFRILKACGVMGLTAEKESYNENNWDARAGKMVLPNGYEVEISVWNIQKPPQCQVESYQETITKYKAICPETGEEIK